MTCPEDCVAELYAMFQEVTPGIDVHVQVKPDVVTPSPWNETIVCPHGVVFLMEPTSEQKMDWAARRVP